MAVGLKLRLLNHWQIKLVLGRFTASAQSRGSIRAHVGFLDAASIWFMWKHSSSSGQMVPWLARICFRAAGDMVWVRRACINAKSATEGSVTKGKRSASRLAKGSSTGASRVAVDDTGKLSAVAALEAWSWGPTSSASQGIVGETLTGANCSRSTRITGCRVIHRQSPAARWPNAKSDPELQSKTQTSCSVKSISSHDAWMTAATVSSGDPRRTTYGVRSVSWTTVTLEGPPMWRDCTHGVKATSSMGKSGKSKTGGSGKGSPTPQWAETSWLSTDPSRQEGQSDCHHGKPDQCASEAGNQPKQIEKEQPSVPSPQLQDEDHQATQVQGLHWEWQSQLEADDGARAWWSQSPIQHLATGQEHHTSHGWTACHDWIPGPYIHNDIQTLDRSSCAMQWVPCCQASRTNGQDSVRTVQFSGVQNQLIQLRLRQSQGALEQISGMLGCKEALQQPSAEKWSCQNSPPTSTARHPHLFEVQGSLGEVISALTSEGVYEATNHRISPCVLYTFQNDRHWTKQIPGAKCLWQREGPASWKRLARKTAHESGWMRMQTEKLLQHLVITNAPSYHRNVRMHLTKSRSKKSTPISSTHRFHTGMIEPQGTDAKSCTQFDHVPQIVTVAPAISDNILHVINKENGHPSFLNQSALENSDGVTWSRDLERSEKLHLGLVWHGQRCPKMVSSDALTTSATTSTWLPSVVAGSKNQLIGVPASPRSEAIAKQDRGSQNHPKSARAALPAGRAFGHETICQIYVIHVIDLV